MPTENRFARERGANKTLGYHKAVITYVAVASVTLKNPNISASIRPKRRAQWTGAKWAGVTVLDCSE